MKRSLKNRLRSLLNFFRDYPNSPRYLKEGNFGVGAEERGLRPNSDRDGKIYCLVVPVLK